MAKSDAYYLKQGVKAMPFVDNVSATLTEGIDSKTHSEEIMNNFRGYLSEEIRKDCSVAVAFRTALVRITSEITESTTAGIELFNKSLYASGIYSDYKVVRSKCSFVVAFGSVFNLIVGLSLLAELNASTGTIYEWTIVSICIVGMCILMIFNYDG